MRVRARPRARNSGPQPPPRCATLRHARRTPRHRTRRCEPARTQARQQRTSTLFSHQQLKAIGV
eukprot:6195544-Pleurochrysis_carterae.AAC.2